MKYFIADDGETIDDARRIPREWDIPAEGFAKDAAKYEYENFEGYLREWPVEISVVLSDGSIEVFLVDMELHPVFGSRKIE